MRQLFVAWALTLTVALAAAPPSPGTPVEAAASSYSGAELLLRLRQALAEDAQRAHQLRSRQRALERQFDAQTAEFNRLDALLQTGTATPAPASPAPAPATPAPTATPPQIEASRTEAGPPVPSAAELQRIERGWQAARDLLDLLFARRQLLGQQLDLLERKRSEQIAAAELINTGPPSGAAAAVEPAAVPKPAESAGQPAGAVAPSATTAPAAAPAKPAAAPAATSAGAAGDTPAAPSEPVAELYDARVARAERQLRHREALLQSTEQAMRLSESLRALSADERGLVHSSIALAERHVDLLRHELAQLAAEPIGPLASEQEPLDQRIARLQRDAQAAQHAVRLDSERLQTLQSRIDGFDALSKHLDAALEDASDEADRARRKLAFLRSPIAPHRITDWLASALPRITVGLSILALTWLVGRWIARRLVGGLLSRIRIRPRPDEERIQRVETLRRALRSALTVTIVVVAALIVLPEFGIDAKVLMGGAAVLSLALAFGAQSLVKDYFSGFMVLSENQYRIGNVVRINELAGVVEDITLRMTMLRDSEGVAHFIPHGQITTVSNMTHGWSQVVVDVRVGLDEDVDRIMAELLQIARTLKQDEHFGPLIVADPDVWGVDAITDSGIVIKLALRTRPLKQWEVKRQLLRRIKNRFDELGIVLPSKLLTATLRNADRHG